MSSFIFEVNDHDFNNQVLQSQKPVIVDFWAPSCSPCIAMGQSLNALAMEYSGQFVVAKMNVDENITVPSELGVRGLPYLLVFKHGKVVESLTGNLSKAKLREIIDRALA